MAEIKHSRKACAVNPLKMSQPIGAALAFLGMDQCLPLMHGSQGCTAFGLVLFVKHFRETIPLQTTAMNEVTTILGGLENVEQALVNIHKRAQPALIGIVSTGITEAKGDDVAGFLPLIREKHPELADMEVVFVSTPDFAGAFQDGWGKAVLAMVEALAKPSNVRRPWQVNILPGCHLTPGDLEEVKEMVEAFGLTPVVLPDLSASMDGHIPETFLPTTLGGTRLDDLRSMGESAYTIVIGEQGRAAAAKLKDIAGVPYTVFDRLTGLKPCDDFLALLSRIANTEVPARFKRQRSQLLDAMLDGHFYFGKKQVAIAAEPDLLYALTSFLTEMGAQIQVAVTSTESPVLHQVPAAAVLIGDLEDFERGAVGADLLITHSHGRQAAERLGIPFWRSGLPTFDRLGAAHQVSVGYRGTRNLIFEVGNVFIENLHEPIHADAIAPTPGEASAGCAQSESCAPAVACH